jgi:thiamine biosynthesis lipoprotein ApbE
MKKGIKILIVLLFLIPFLGSSQQNPNDDLQKVKDALVNSVMYCQQLEKENANLNATIKKVAEDLKRIETIDQLDSLKIVYGIIKK